MGRLCPRCNKYKIEESFIDVYMEQCRPCTKETEVFEWVKPEISILMKDLKPGEKSEIIKRIVKEHRKKHGYNKAIA